MNEEFWNVFGDDGSEYSEDEIEEMLWEEETKSDRHTTKSSSKPAARKQRVKRKRRRFL